MITQPQHQREATAALLTPRGRGAVATIRFHGDCGLIDAADPPLFRAANGRPLARQEAGRIVFGHWGAGTREEIVVCRTDETCVEIHCHGGETAVKRILADLESAGCAIRPWRDAAARCERLLETECLDALTRATTLRTARILLDQQTGALRQAVEELLDGNSLSFSRGPAGRAARPTSGRCPAAAKHDERPSQCRDEIVSKLDALLRWSDFGLHLTRPWKVVLAGRPNVGKSSLTNALIGYGRSIVYDQPGTTRDVVTAETALDGWPIQLADTAGLRAGADTLESAGIDRARRMLAEADCRVLLIDVGRPPHQEDRRLLSEWPDALQVAHKCDLPNVWGDELPSGSIRVSSVTGEGLKELGRALVARLVPEVPDAGTPLPVTVRQIELLQSARQALLRGDQPAFRAALEALLAKGA